MTTREGPGGWYRFYFNNTASGVHFPAEGELLSLRPFEVAIRTTQEVWV